VIQPVNQNRRRRAAGVVRVIASRYGAMLWVLVIALMGLLYVWRQQGEVAEIGFAVRRADPRWLALLVIVNLGVLASAGLSYRIVLARLGHHLTWRDCAQIHLQRHVAGTITPMGGPASVYVLIRALGQRGIASTDALLTTTIRSFSGYLSFVVLLVPVLVLQRPSTLVLAGATMLLGLLVVVLAGLLLLLRGGAVPVWVARRCPAYLVRFIGDARAHGICPRDLVAPFALAFANNLAGSASVYIGLRAIGFEPRVATGLVGYAIGNLFQIVAPIFQGFGIVELTMALALQQQGVPLAGAAGATLLFRLGDVWLLLLVALLIQVLVHERVRITVSRAMPVAAGVSGALLLLAVPHGSFASEVVLAQLNLPLLPAIVAMMTLAGSLILISVASCASRRSTASFMPFAVIVAAIPLVAFVNTNVSDLIPF
jgi:uncharacterized protein (TIRG00374 family)